MIPRSPTAENHTGWKRLLAAIILVQMIALTAVSCRAVGPDKQANVDSEVRRLRRQLEEMNRQERALQSEYSLARNSTPYLVISLSGQRIELKARGRILRSFSVKETEIRDRTIKNDAAWTLAEVKPIQSTDRPKIKPGAGEAATAEAARQMLWGLHRMPQDYDLVCSDGNILQVRALPAEKSGIGFIRAIITLYRRSIDRFRRLRTPHEMQLQHIIQLWLDENESRLLFWSLPKQLKILVLADAALSSIFSKNSFMESRPFSWHLWSRDRRPFASSRG